MKPTETEIEHLARTLAAAFNGTPDPTSVSDVWREAAKVAYATVRPKPVTHEQVASLEDKALDFLRSDLYGVDVKEVLRARAIVYAASYAREDYLTEKYGGLYMSVVGNLEQHTRALEMTAADVSANKYEPRIAVLERDLRDAQAAHERERKMHVETDGIARENERAMAQRHAIQMHDTQHRLRTAQIAAEQATKAEMQAVKERDAARATAKGLEQHRDAAECRITQLEDECRRLRDGSVYATQERALAAERSARRTAVEERDKAIERRDAAHRALIVESTALRTVVEERDRARALVKSHEAKLTSLHNQCNKAQSDRDTAKNELTRVLAQRDTFARQHGEAVATIEMQADTIDALTASLKLANDTVSKVGEDLQSARTERDLARADLAKQHTATRAMLTDFGDNCRRTEASEARCKKAEEAATYWQEQHDKVRCERNSIAVARDAADVSALEYKRERDGVWQRLQSAHACTRKVEEDLEAARKALKEADERHAKHVHMHGSASVEALRADRDKLLLDLTKARMEKEDIMRRAEAGFARRERQTKAAEAERDRKAEAIASQAKVIDETREACAKRIHEVSNECDRLTKERDEAIRRAFDAEGKLTLAMPPVEAASLLTFIRDGLRELDTDSKALEAKVKHYESSLIDLARGRKGYGETRWTARYILDAVGVAW